MGKTGRQGTAWEIQTEISFWYTFITFELASYIGIHSDRFYGTLACMIYHGNRFKQ